MNHKGKEIVVIGSSPNDIKEKLFLTKLDERGNMARARVVKLINEFDDKLDRDHYAANSRLSLKRIPPLVKTLTLTTSCLTTISWTILKEKPTT